MVPRTGTILTIYEDKVELTNKRRDLIFAVVFLKKWEERLNKHRIHLPNIRGQGEVDQHKEGKPIWICYEDPEDMRKKAIFLYYNE